MKNTIIKILQKEEAWLQQMVDEAHAHGDIQVIPPIQLKIVGQMALLIANLPFPIAATMDIDILHNLPHFAAKKLGELFLDNGLVLESDQHLIWMPEQTIYHPLFDGSYVHASVADPLYVIASKCKFKRAKDKAAIQSYCQCFPEALQKIEAMNIDTA
jgi:hypothetical protein